MWNKVPEKQIASQIIKKVLAFFRTQRVINVFARPCPEPDK